VIKDIAVQQALKNMCWASEIEWPVVKHTSDKKINKGCFEREKLCIDGAEVSSSCDEMTMSK
jgi:hypothetical protein